MAAIADVRAHNSHRQMAFSPKLPLTSIPVLSPAEIEVLESLGAWMAALANGNLTPFTDEHFHFLDVSAGRAPPRTKFERAWKKYVDFVEVHDRADANRIRHLRASRMAEVRKSALSSEELQALLNGEGGFDLSLEERQEVAKALKANPLHITVPIIYRY